MVSNSVLRDMISDSDDPFSVPPGWRSVVYANTASTNIEAREEPAWSIVRSHTQRGGRGRFDREWFSPAGGLWVSFVVPPPRLPSAGDLGVYPLAVGWAFVGVLKELGIAEARLRWPNDLMIADRKAGGLLLEMKPKKKIIVGLGLNVRNTLEFAEAPATPATRLADHLEECPELPTLASNFALALTALHERIEREGFPGILREINFALTPPRHVRVVRLDGSSTEGELAGLDDDGSPLLRLPGGGYARIPAGDVLRLEENV